jgi:hypothetical protein
MGFATTGKASTSGISVDAYGTVQFVASREGGKTDRSLDTNLLHRIIKPHDGDTN